MSTKHSPGPWKATFNTRKERGVRNSGGFICVLPKPNHYTGQDKRYEEEMKENEADARLIAAAPDLLEALKIAAEIAEKNYQAECFEVDWHNNNTPGVGQNTDYKTRPPRPKWLESARAAIARAEGAQPEQEHTGEPDPTDLAREFQEGQDYAAQPTEYDP